MYRRYSSPHPLINIRSSIGVRIGGMTSTRRPAKTPSQHFGHKKYDKKQNAFFTPGKRLTRSCFDPVVQRNGRGQAEDADKEKSKRVLVVRRLGHQSNPFRPFQHPLVWTFRPSARKGRIRHKPPSG